MSATALGYPLDCTSSTYENLLPMPADHTSTSQLAPDIDTTADKPSPDPVPIGQMLTGCLVLLLATLMVWGASFIPLQNVPHPYSGNIGAAFVPWLCAITLTACGLMLVREALGGGYRNVADPGGRHTACWPPFLWVSAALLCTFWLMPRVGFTLSSALCYTLAMQGLRRAALLPAADATSPVPVGTADAATDTSDSPACPAPHACHHPKVLLGDLACGLVLAGLLYWLLTRGLGLPLPALRMGSLTLTWL